MFLDRLQSFLQGLDRVPLRESAKRSLRMPALADAAGCMATRAIPGEKSLAPPESGHVLRSHSYHEGEIDTSDNTLMIFFSGEMRPSEVRRCY
jgi:hypothetical protein